MGEHTVRINIGFIQALIAVMLTLGAIALAGSFTFTSTILAFIGLGLIFWGALLLYIKPEGYTKRVLIDAVSSPSLTTLNEMIQELCYKGDATYLPPKYFTNPETTKVYIAKNKRGSLPAPEVIRIYENKSTAKTALGILITPPGIELSKLLEKSLGRRFAETNLKDLQQKLPKLFIEDLEIAENLELKTEDGPTESMTVHAKITKPFYTDLPKEAEELSQAPSAIGGPICSAIAIALTKATGKPVRITDTKSSEDDSTLEAIYETLEA